MDGPHSALHQVLVWWRAHNFTTMKPRLDDGQGPYLKVSAVSFLYSAAHQNDQLYFASSPGRWSRAHYASTQSSQRCSFCCWKPRTIPTCSLLKALTSRWLNPRWYWSRPWTEYSANPGLHASASPSPEMWSFQRRKALIGKPHFKKRQGFLKARISHCNLNNI